MSEQKNNTPNIRFPEFSGEWEEKKLGDSFHLHNGYAFKSDTYISDGKYKIVTIANVQSGNLDLSKTNSINQLPSNIADHQKLNIGDIILSMTGNVGRVCMVDQHNCLLNQRVGLLKQINEHVDRRYVYSVINSKQFETAMIKSGQGAAQANISKEDVEAYSFWAPTDPAEQEKIADCLSSMDELIAAQAEKVDALKEKKTGLMQQLFPQPGETTPRLRFPEFIGEWEEKKLGEIGDVCMCKRIMKHETSPTGGIPFYKIGTFGKKADAFISVELFREYQQKYSYPNKGDILFSAAGTIGRSVVFDGEPAYFQDSNIVWVSNDESKVLNAFLKYIYTTIEWKIDDGGIVKRLYNDSIRKTSFWAPPTLDEQQKIASCLSTLDDQIAAETEKLTALKEHKKGLMQQLFPQPAK